MSAEEEQRQFFKRAADAIHEIAFLGAKLGLPPDVITPRLVRVEVERVMAGAKELPGLKLEVERLRHDVASLRTTNETLADQLARARAHEVEL